MSTIYSLAIDLGAESGRIMLGKLQDKQLSLSEVHRFSHGSVSGQSLRWNLDLIVQEIMKGLQKAAGLGHSIASISTDSWGVDYVLLGENNEVLDAPHHYRDPRTQPIFDRMHGDKDMASLLYCSTGIQSMNINTVYQLVAELEKRPDLLKKTKKFLLIADYINYLLSGEIVAESSLASTTQIYNPSTATWSKLLIEKLNLPPGIFPEIKPAGTILGPLVGPLAKEPAFAQTKIIATCSHDTGAAVAAVPAENTGWAYLSSGTWSLLGVELSEPKINEQSLSLNYTNEIGYNNSVRLLKNLSGLWTLQECRRAWAAAGEEYSYEDLVNLAAAQRQGQCPLINLQWSEFALPGNMPEKIDRFCELSGQSKPQTVGQYVRTILESLALLYQHTLVSLEKLVEMKIDRIHIVGGGCQNLFLNQLTANILNRTVIAGPVEATAMGNLLIQAVSLGELADLNEIRSVIRFSFPTKIFTPESGNWSETLPRFEKIFNQNI